MKVDVQIKVRAETAGGAVTEADVGLELEGNPYGQDPMQGAINNGLEGARKIVQTTLEKRA